MPSKKIGAEDLVAHYLRSRGYNNALESFIREANLPAKVGEGLEQSWTLETILEEKRLYDLTVKFETTDLLDKAAVWKKPWPTVNRRLHFEPASNVLQVNVVKLRSKPNNQVEQFLLVSTAARRLYKYALNDNSSESWSEIDVTPDSPILSFVVLSHRFIIFTTISGSILVYDTLTNETTAKRKDHQKYAVQITTITRDDQTYIATAGWDSRVLLYTLESSNDNIALSEPVAVVQLPSVPESIVFVTDQLQEKLYLIIGRRDSTFLHYCEINPSIASSLSTDLPLSGKQNLAPYATMWNAFSPAYLSLCPTDPTLLAVATNSIPHMKVLLVRLLFPQADKNEPASLPNQPDQPQISPAAPSVDNQAIDPREVAAVLAHTNTNVAQTRFSTPVIAWRPDGSGFWVNSEEGTIKGIDRSGKIQATLQGHEYASKVRCLWAGAVRSQDDAVTEKEYLISGGFDQKLLIWDSPEIKS